MKRSTPIKRTAFRKEGPSVSREAKPRAEKSADRVKTKPCAYEKCGREFVPMLPLQNVCRPICAQRYARQLRDEKEAKEKADFQARKDKIKKLTTLEGECRDIVQAVARIRDRHDGCISCHMGANYGGKWNGSHFRPAGNNAAVQFHLWNIHKACVQCNLHKGGNIAAYRPRLVDKIGEDRVKWLESQNQVVKYGREYLLRFKRVMGKRLRRVQRAAKQERTEA